MWIVVWYFTQGDGHPGAARRRHAPTCTTALTEFNNALLAGRDTNPVMQFTNAIADLLRSAFEWLQRMIVVPNPPRPVPEIGWLGVVAIATYVGLVIASWRIALLAAATFLSFGVLGYCQDWLDLLIIIGICRLSPVVIGMPLAVLIGTSTRANTISRLPRTSCRQCRPSSPAADRAVLRHRCQRGRRRTLVYALPRSPHRRAPAIPQVPTTTIEATDSAGQTLAAAAARCRSDGRDHHRRPDETTLAALSMATLAAFVDGRPGQAVLAGLRINDVGSAVRARRPPHRGDGDHVDGGRRRASARR